MKAVVCFKKESRKHEFNFETEMTRLTLRIAGMTLFNLDLSSDVDMIGRTFATMLPQLTHYVLVPFPPLWVPTPRYAYIPFGGGQGILRLDCV